MATGANISEKIKDIRNQRNTIRGWLISIGKAETTSKLEACATAISNIPTYLNERDFSIAEGASYTIPEGYHDGTQVITNVNEEAEGHFILYEITHPISPTKTRQTFSIPEGYYGFSSFTVDAIGEAYQDVTAVTATEADVLTGKIFVASNGDAVTGTMVNNGAVTTTLDINTTSFTIPVGYHNGFGTVSISLEEKTATPTKSSQTISPPAEKVLSKVIINPIPDEYITTSDADATEENILNGKTAYVDGEKVTGTMPNRGSITASIVGLTAENSSYTIPKGYHDGTGKVSLSGDIEADLADI